uniref:branched-chain-amino-acid transaminase n=1 Tax=Angiostrongylus cantonensis TaxID=6313 RepID=A0A158PBF6_ANGCA
MLHAAWPLQRSLLTLTFGRHLTGNANRKVATFYHKELIIIEAKSKKERRPISKEGDTLRFGEMFCDHMLDVDWSADKGWGKPCIRPYENLSLDPSCKVFHYASGLFEGMKAYRGVDNRIRLFRPELNMLRMRKTAARAALPDFDGDELLECIKEMVRLDQSWVPRENGASLYIRPTLIGTDPRLGLSSSRLAKLFVITSPVGPYFTTYSPIALLANPQYIRAAKGGVGGFKMGSNYAPTVYVSEKAIEKGCHQVLWLSGPEHYVTEAGAMNTFLYWKNEEGDEELITPTLESGLILPGVTRQSILELSQEIGGFKVTERDFTVAEVKTALNENRVHEFFASGTAAVITPIGRVLYINEEKEETLRFPAMDRDKSLMQRLEISLA